MRLRARLARVGQRLDSNVPGICFGTRKLFRQQRHLALAGFESREAWLCEWRTSRSHQVFFVGSKDETAGRPGVRTAPMVAASAPHPSAGATVCPCESKLREQICAP